jgi:Zn-dependent protease
VAGIDLYVHATFGLLLGWLLLSDLMRGKTLAVALTTTLLVVTVFACVVLHELGHALTAKRFGCRTRDITLLPIGGVARLERMPDRPAQEIAVALAGPAVNLVIAGVLLAASQLVSIALLDELMWINVSLGVFNLLPAYPMDGGRVLRAVLAASYGQAKATAWAARVGKALALALGAVGVFTNPILVLIALFIWSGADAEARAMQVRTAVHDVKVEQAMRTELRTLAPDTPLSEAITLLESGAQDDFPVVDARGRCVGIVSRATALSALTARGPATPVCEIMKEPSRIAASETLQQALDRFGEQEAALVVERDGHPVGLVTADSLSHWLMVHAALDARATRQG